MRARSSIVIASFAMACGEGGSTPLVEPASTTDTSVAPSPETSTGSADSHATVADASTGPIASSGEGPIADLAVEPGPFVLYLAPDGDDANAGDAPTRPLATLAAAEAILIAAVPDRPVELRFAGGDYVVTTTVWHHVDPAHTTSFVAADPATPPHFTPAPGELGYFVYVSAQTGQPSNLVFDGLHIDGFVTGGIALVGNADDPTRSNGANVITNCVFENLGNAGGETQPGYAAIALYNSDDNLVEGNRFVGLENRDGDALLLHAVYLAHHASGNLVTGNEITDVSGAAFRARNDCNDNVFEHNTLFHVGEAVYGDWYCDASQNPVCERQECPSWQNWVRDNVASCGFGDPLVLFEYAHGVDYVPNGCPDHADDGWPRLQTAGNQFDPGC